MKVFRKILLAAALSLPGCLFAQETIDVSQNVTIQGTAGKMIIFKAVPNMAQMTLSRNGRFLIGGESDEGGSSVGVIYEIATGKMQRFNSGVIEVIDWDNYVTADYAKIDGVEYFDFRKIYTDSNDFVVEEASADLLTLRASIYLEKKGSDYSNIIVETKTGRVLDTLGELDPDYPRGGKMNMGWSMSDDAKIVVGRASLEGAPINYAPAFWDRDRGEVFFTGYTYPDPRGTGKTLFTSGEMRDVDGSGTKLCGTIKEQACYATYDRTAGTFQVSYIDPDLGYDGSTAYQVNREGVVLGVDQRGIDVYSRRPFIYFSESGQKYILADYLKYLYGLDSERDMPLLSTTGLSDNGRLISGYSYENMVWYSYLIILDEHQTYAPVRNVQVQNYPRRSPNVVVNWQEPLQGEYTLTGYNVFRDKQKVNDQPIAANTRSFTDENVANGRHKYFVQAVYGDKVSEAIDTVSIIIVDPNGCLPVQELFSDVEYNRTVSLCWGLPTDRESSNVIIRPKRPAPKYIPQEGLDFVSVFQPSSDRMSAGVRINDYIYAGSYESSSIYVYDPFGNLQEAKHVDGMGGIYDMAYRDNAFYVAAGTERVTVLDLNPDDPFDISESNHFTTTLGKVISVTYVENDNSSVNNGEDYLIVGDYYHLVAYPLSATGPDDEFSLPVEFDVDGMIIAGCEYYKGRLYLSNQNGTNGCDVVAYDMATGKKLFTTDLYAHPTVVDASTGGIESVYAGGLTHTVLADGTVALECLVQCQYAYNMIVDMELESAEDVLGYVVYRNGERVSDTLKARHFTEEIDSAGTYVYHVEYFSTRGCSSSSKDMDVTRTVSIYEKGECSAPKELRVYESDRKAILSWSEDCFDSDGFVGFNLYRNGERIGDKNFLRLRYIDSEVETGTEYLYCLEAFYNTSCKAFDTVEITLDGKGAAREPAAFKVEGTFNQDNTVDAKATWGLPYFEEPMAYGYCGVPAGGNSLDGTSQLFCIVGWMEEDMDKFDDDLYLVGVEFMLATDHTKIKTLSTVVYTDDNMVYNKPYDERFQAREWVRVYFDQVFKMKQKNEIAVGYSVSYDPDEIKASQTAVFAFDMGPRTMGKSDLISSDGRDFGTLYAVTNGALDVNFCINALVVRQRDLEAAASAADPQAYVMRKVLRMDWDGRLGEEQRFTDAPKTTSEGIKLLGFNIYRDGEKLNENLLTDLSYEENVGRGEYDYEVGAVYEGADEQKTSFFADFTLTGVEEMEQAYGVGVYPNPASDRLNIRGAYVSFSLVDMNGRVWMRDVRNTESVSLAGLNEGVYFMMITLPNGDRRSVKVVKR